MPQSAYANWQTLAQKEIKSEPLESLSRQTLEDIALEPVYPTPDGAFPGVFPYRRGPKATMYRVRPWTIRQYAGFSSAETTNQFYHECLKGGQKGLSVAFDLPTHRGYDSDNPLVAGDVGKAGVAINTADDMALLFKGIPLSEVSVSMTMNGAVLPVMAAFIVAAQEQGASLNQLSGTIQNDILKEFLVRNTFIYPPSHSMRIVADVIVFISTQMPQFNSISISGYHIHEAGADLALELGLTLADGLEYVRAALSRGLAIDSFAPRLSFFFATGMNFYMEIAKLRAARQLWSELMAQFSPQDPRSSMLRTHCQTSGWSLTAQDPYNNIIRTTIEAMASVFGGTQSLHTNAFDEAFALPSSASARVARNTQLIIQHETGITHVADPWGGSTFMESLTDSLIEKAREIILRVEELGGMTKAVASGVPKSWIDESAAKRQAKIDSGEEVIVGVNRYQAPEEPAINVLTVDNEAVRQLQVARLAQVRRRRDDDKVKEALERLEFGAHGQANLLELSIDAMRARATLGEVSYALERVFGRHEAAVSTVSGVYRRSYENEEELNAVVMQVESFAREAGRRPRMLVAKLGQDGHDRGAKVVASAFADLGFDVDLSPLFQTPDEVARHAVENDVHVVGVSTLAAAHRTLVPQLIASLKEVGAGDVVVVVGGVIPPQDHEWLRLQGVAHVFGPGTSIVKSAGHVLDAIRQAGGYV